MCQRAVCRSCRKMTYEGCGRHVGQVLMVHAAALSHALALLAQPCARHPHYRQEWRPR
ncbi:DUF6221 family protein [Streptomyces lydicus]|uniref:DUF6221 family protein n=1 Tax=Streptomyces lydicus TaxID=47763 RepID=UPI0036FA3526